MNTPLLRRWLQQVQQLPQASRERLWLRGSLLTSTLIPHARPPADIDYLVAGKFNYEWVLGVINQTIELKESDFELLTEHLIWEDTAFPGVRCLLKSKSFYSELQIDFSFHDPVSLPAQKLTVLDIPEVQTCAAEDLWGWKLHGLVEFGRGSWRAKDLYDLARLLETPLNQEALVPAIQLAFSSRDCLLSELEDFLRRPDWGCSSSSRRKWRRFWRNNGLDSERQVSLVDCRDLVREQVSNLEILNQTPNLKGYASATLTLP